MYLDQLVIVKSSKSSFSTDMVTGEHSWATNSKSSNKSRNISEPKPNVLNIYLGKCVSFLLGIPEVCPLCWGARAIIALPSDHGWPCQAPAMDNSKNFLNLKNTNSQRLKAKIHWNLLGKMNLRKTNVLFIYIYIHMEEGRKHGGNRAALMNLQRNVNRLQST